MELIIREAAASDYDQLCEVLDEVDALHQENLPHVFRKPVGPVRARDYILGLIADETVGFFVAQVADRLAGLIYVAVREAPEVPIFVRRQYAVIDAVVVRETFRRAGIGRALVDRAHNWAAGKGAESIELNVWEFNQEAIAFYRALGYETVSRKMSKRLSRAAR